MPTALAISPHLDDAVFSAGGTLARLSGEHWRVVVATVFTASVANPTGFALACQLDKGLEADVDYMALRRAEDAAACAIVGAEPLWLPFVEAPHRGYASAAALFGELRGDDDILARLTPALEQLVTRQAPDLLLAPQAVGAHVDHVAVHLAASRLSLPCCLWVDFPYSVRSSYKPSPFARDLASLPLQAIKLAPAEIDAKIAAALAYASQIGFQFNDAAGAASTLAANGGEERFAVPDVSAPWEPTASAQNL